MRISVFIIILLTLLPGCIKESSKKEAIQEPNPAIKYAQGFNIEYFETYKKITVNRLFKGSSDVREYYLYSEDASEIPQNSIAIKVPLESIVCSSTTHLPALVMLDEVESLVGFPSVKYISSPQVLERINQNAIEDLGSENGMNIEGILEINPDVLMGFLMTADSKIYNKIEDAGVPVVINSDYLENTPLGRAEWIKFVAAFYNKEEMADSIFKAIEENYLNIKRIAEDIDPQPTVFSGIMYSDTWYMPGGESFASIFISDAGGNFLWGDNNETGSLELSFETVLETAGEAQFWIGASNFRSKSDMQQSDERYSLFDAFKNNRVYTYTLNVTENGGNDFFETAYARPDWVLSDLVKILHPQLLQDNEFHFYQRLD